MHVANSNCVNPTFRIADKAVVTPLIYSKEYIPFLKDYCRDNSIDAIISLFDIDLLVLSKHKKEFETIGVRVIVSDESFVEICNDKWKTYNFLKSCGINTPQTFLSIDSVKERIDYNELQYPLVLKPRWGMGSISVFDANDEEELNILFNKIKKDIQKTYLKHESAFDMDNCVVIQQKVFGQEYGLDIINDLNGNYINTIVKKKIAMRAGETDCAITENNFELKRIGQKIGNITGHIANLDVDIFLSGDIIYVLEMNARFGGGYPFSHMAGIDLPSAIINWINNYACDETLFKEKIGVMSHKDISLVRLS